MISACSPGAPVDVTAVALGEMTIGQSLNLMDRVGSLFGILLPVGHVGSTFVPGRFCFIKMRRTVGPAPPFSHLIRQLSPLPCECTALRCGAVPCHARMGLRDGHCEAIGSVNISVDLSGCVVNNGGVSVGRVRINTALICARTGSSPNRSFRLQPAFACNAMVQFEALLPCAATIAELQQIPCIGWRREAEFNHCRASLSQRRHPQSP